jgi:hypothetical protein
MYIGVNVDGKIEGNVIGPLVILNILKLKWLIPARGTRFFYRKDSMARKSVRWAICNNV